jgi:hypothetical protein
MKILHRVLLGAALLIMLFHLAVYVNYAANLISFPFDYDQGEGFELYDTLLLSQFQSPYRSAEVYPYYASNYPPVFHVMAVPFMWAFGPEYWYGRLLGFIGTLITASAIAWAVYRDGQRRTGKGNLAVSILAGLAFLASNIVYRQGPLLRQHMTMVMFETLAVVVLAHAEDMAFTRSRKWRFAVGFGLLILAGYTKQLAAYSAVAVLLWLFIRNPRRAVACGVIFGTVGAGIFAVLTLSTGGEWWRQAIVANVGGTFWPQTEGLFRLWYSLHGFLVIPAALLVAYELYFERISLYAVWFAVTLALGGASSGTWGGGDSYFATSVAGLTLLSGIFFSRLIARDFHFPSDNYLSRLIFLPLRRLAPAVGLLALVLVPALYGLYGRAVLKMPTTGPVFETLATWWGITPNALNGFYDSAGRIAGGYSDIGHLVTEEDRINAERITDLLRNSDKPVLSEEAGFSFRAGEDVITNPTQLLNLWLRGTYDGSELIRDIDAKRFGYLILRAQFYPTPVLLAMARNYETVEVIPMNGFQYIIRVPTPGSGFRPVLD